MSKFTAKQVKDLANRLRNKTLVGVQVLVAASALEDYAAFLEVIAEQAQKNMEEPE